MKQLHGLFWRMITIAALAFLLGFAAGIEAKHRNDVNIQEARER